MSIISEISSFIIIIFGLLAAIISVLEGESRRRIVMFVILIGVILLLICWELYRIEDNCVRQKEDSMRPVVEKLDEILKLMKTGGAATGSVKSSTGKTPASGQKRKDKQKAPSSRQSSDASLLLREQEERILALEEEVRSLQKQCEIAMTDKKKPDQNFNEFENVKKKNSTTHSSRKVKVKSPKTVKKLPPAKAASLPSTSVQSKLVVETFPATSDHRYTSRLCLSGKKATHIPSIQTMIRLLRISETGEKADFDIMLPNSYVRRMAGMKEGSRRPFESNRKAYFFELVQLRTGCADVAVNERKIEQQQIRIQ